MPVEKIIFWVCGLLLSYTYVGYPVLAWVRAGLRPFFFSSRRRHTRSVSAFLLNRSSDLQLHFSKLFLILKSGVNHTSRGSISTSTLPSIKLRKCSSKIITSILSFISGRLATKSNQIKQLIRNGRSASLQRTFKKSF